jgi:hypothetical protein
MLDRTVLECDTVRCLRRRSGVESKGVFSVAASSSETSGPIGPCRTRWDGWVLVGTSQSATESDGTRVPSRRFLLERLGLVVYGGGGSLVGCAAGANTRSEVGEADSAILQRDDGGFAGRSCQHARLPTIARHSGPTAQIRHIRHLPRSKRMYHQGKGRALKSSF